MNQNSQQIPKAQPSMIKKFIENTKKLNLYQNISQTVRLSFEYKGNIQEQVLTNNFHISISYKNLGVYQYTKITPKCENILQNKVYVCYDCQVNAEAFICEECFYSAGHDIKCHYQIKQIPEFLHGYYKCCCGTYQKMSYKGTCCKHHQREYVQKQSKQAQEKIVLDFVSYYTDCWKLFICLSSIFLQMKDQMNNDQIQKMRQAIFSGYGKQLFNNFSNNVYWTNNYTQKISSCLLSKTNVDDIRKAKQLAHLNQDTSILEIIIQILPCNLEEELILLIEKLLKSKSEALVREVVSSIFNCPMTNGKMNKLGWITKLNKNQKLQPSFYCKILCDLARDGKFAYEQSQQPDAIKFYAMSSCPNLFLKKQDKILSSLVQCWKGLFSKGILTPQNIIKTPGYTLTQILMFTIYDEQLFHESIISLIKFIKSEQSEVKLKLKLGMIKKIQFTGLCDALVELLNNYFEGQIRKIAKYLRNIQLDSELVVITNSYFKRCIKQPVKMNGETLAIFGAYLQMLRVQEPDKYLQYEKLSKKRSAQKGKVTEFIAKSLKYLISQQLIIQSKKNKYLHKRSLEQEKILQRKFKQFLCMRKTVPRKQIHKMLKQKILNFSGAAQIIKNYTTFNLGNDSFIFTASEEEYFNYDGILSSILSPSKQEVNVIFTPQVSDNMFTTEDRKNILTGILTPYLKEKDMKMYKNEQKIEYLPSICLIIIDKILNGQILQLRNYLIETKQTLIKQNSDMKNSSEQSRLYKIFGISELSKKNTDENQNLMNFDTNLLEKTQQILIKEEVPNNVVTLEQKIQSIKQKSEKIKTSKYLKIAEKFKLKQQKILKKNNICTDIIPQKKENAYKEICMICKQEGNQNNALFYLGVLNKQNSTNQIFQSTHRKQYTIDLCMHVIHEKCYLTLCKGSVFQCPLCKIYSNIVFPYQNQIMDGKAREFMQNRLTYTFIQSFNEYHYENTFNFILKTLISEVLSNLIFNVIMRSSLPPKLNIQKNLQQKKINYYFGFLKQWWESLEDYEKQYFILKVQKNMAVNQQSYKRNLQIKRNPKEILDSALCFIIWECISEKKFTQIIRRQLSILEELIDQTQFNSVIAYLQKQFSLNKYINGKELMEQQKKMNFINHFFKPPQTLSQLQLLAKSCKTCKKVSKGWFCLQCNESFCNTCGHEKFHGTILAKLNSINGKIQYQDKKGNLHAEKLYVNSFMQTWSSAEQNHDDYFDYRICNDLFRKILSK